MTTATKPRPKKLEVGDILTGKRFNEVLLTMKPGTVVCKKGSKTPWMNTTHGWVDANNTYGMTFKADDLPRWEIIVLA